MHGLNRFACQTLVFLLGTTLLTINASNGQDRKAKGQENGASTRKNKAKESTKTKEAIRPFAGWSKEFESKLQTPQTATWAGATLRDVSAKLAEVTSVPIFLDRRIDPDQTIDLSCQDQPLETLLNELAVLIGAEHVAREPLIYFGPKDAADRFASLIEVRRDEVLRLPPKVRSRLASARELSWPKLQSPRDLVVSIATEADFEIMNPEAIEHDLWGPMSLPKMALSDRLTLILAGFDLTFHVESDGKRIELRQAPDRVRYERLHVLRAGVSRPDVADFEKQIPDAKLVLSGSQVRATATALEHQKLHDTLTLVKKPKQVAPTPSNKVFTLTVQQQVAIHVLRSVAEQAGYSIRETEKSPETLAKRISFSVEKVSMDSLVKQISNLTGAKVRVEGKVIIID